MIHTIKNSFLEVQVSEAGAELMSITAGGTDYLWNGDKAYWGGRAPHLFPYVGRLTGNQYTYRGKAYQMNRHGFAKASRFALAGAGAENVRLHLEDSEESRAVYPQAFSFDVSYVLEDSTLAVVYSVETGAAAPCTSAWGPIPGSGSPWRRGGNLPATA